MVSGSRGIRRRSIIGALNALKKIVKRTKVVEAHSDPENGLAASKFPVNVERWRADFDASFYYECNPDVVESGLDAFAHYRQYGWREGRNPHPLFWTSYYVSEHADVKESQINPYFHYLEFGKAEGRKPNPLGLRQWPEAVAPDDDSWLSLKPRASIQGAEVAVIVPVYRGFADTLACIFSVLSAHQANKFCLLVVDDCSPEPELSSKLRELSSLGLFKLIVNEKNLGFVRSVNKAVEEAGDCDCILLNSDTEVYSDWLDRLKWHADQDPNIATVTPFSNNATICSYPDACSPNSIALECSLEQLDMFAGACGQGMSIEIPTGVGFCFYIRREAIAKIGAFDVQTFKMGYGEENDFCMRALKAGYRNLLACNVFVYHRGRVSFGSAKGIEATRALNRKHPDYEPRIKAFLGADPARVARVRLDLYRVAAAVRGRCVIIVTHGLGGGIETHTDWLVERLRQCQVNVVRMQTAGDANVAIKSFMADQSSIYIPSAQSLNVHRDFAVIKEFVGWSSPLFIHVHSLAGISAAAESRMIDLLLSIRIPMYFTAHDYRAICHRNHLAFSDGSYCGMPRMESCERCFESDVSCNDAMEPRERRIKYGQLLEKCILIAPSKDTVSRFTSNYRPHRVLFRPHESASMYDEVMVVNKPKTLFPFHIAIIGAIGAHKGSLIIESMARDAKQRTLPLRITIIGYSDRTQSMSAAGVKETGRYGRERDALAELMADPPHVVFFPSTCPETFGYSLSFAKHYGYPVAAFDIGALAERVHGSGTVLDFELAKDPASLNDEFLKRHLNGGFVYREVTRRERVYDTLLPEYYDFESTAVHSPELSNTSL